MCSSLIAGVPLVGFPLPPAAIIVIVIIWRRPPTNEFTCQDFKYDIRPSFQGLQDLQTYRFMLPRLPIGFAKTCRVCSSDLARLARPSKRAWKTRLPRASWRLQRVFQQTLQGVQGLPRDLACKGFQGSSEGLPRDLARPSKRPCFQGLQTLQRLLSLHRDLGSLPRHLKGSPTSSNGLPRQLARLARP